MSDKAPDDYSWADVVEALKPLPGIKEAVVKLGELPDKGAPVYEAFSMLLPVGGPPVLLLGADVSRVRLLVSTDAATANTVSVGKYSVLASDDGAGTLAGFPISSIPQELKTTDSIFVRLSPEAVAPAWVSVWVEKVAN